MRSRLKREMGLLLMNWLSLDEVIYTLMTVTAGLHVNTACFYQICHREGFTRSCCLVNGISRQVNTTCAADGAGMVVSTLCPFSFTRWRWHFLTLVCHLLGYFIDRNDIFGTNYNASRIQIASVVTG